MITVLSADPEVKPEDERAPYTQPEAAWWAEATGGGYGETEPSPYDLHLHTMSHFDWLCEELDPGMEGSA